jgi:hypothetical protein
MRSLENIYNQHFTGDKMKNFMEIIRGQIQVLKGLNLTNFLKL